MPPPRLLRKLGILWTLYFVQGLPFGFQATALPVYLRTAGMSLEAIGFATALSLPWSLKIFAAPFVDRYGSERFGHRRSWILPLQVGLMLCCAAAGILPGQAIAPLLLLVFGMNLFAATMDIAVDGLAVDVLDMRELGHGNVAQVVGYKLGMLTGGGLLVWASGAIGWKGLFLVMAALVGLCLLVTFAWREGTTTGAGGERPPRPQLQEIFATLRGSLRRPGAAWFLVFVGTYKLGESMADTMFKPFLVDAHFSPQQIGLWVGTWGMLCSIVGSIAGGWLAGRTTLLRAVGITAALRALVVGGEWWLSLVHPTPQRVLAVTCAEHLFGGALTTAMFAYMMSRVDRRIGATHYTAIAAVEVLGKLPSAWLSGVVARHTSYATLFGVATVLSVAFLFLLVPLASTARQREPAPAPASA